MKCYNYKGRELLPLAVSDAARAGDVDAVEQVLRYYEGTDGRNRERVSCSFR